MNPLEQISCHWPDTFDTLRIIAGERGRLDAADREAIKAAAVEMETQARELSRLRFDLSELQSHVRSLTEQVIMHRRNESALVEKIAEMKRPWYMNCINEEANMNRLNEEANKRLAEAQARGQQPPVMLSYSTGWIKCEAWTWP